MKALIDLLGKRWCIATLLFIASAAILNPPADAGDHTLASWEADFSQLAEAGRPLVVALDENAGVARLGIAAVRFAHWAASVWRFIGRSAVSECWVTSVRT